MISAVAWAKEHGLIGQDVVGYEQRWDRGTVFENERVKLVWDFEFHLRKTTTSRRPDLILETEEDRKILICDMACPQQQNIDTKRMEKLTKYGQLFFQLFSKLTELQKTEKPICLLQYLIVKVLFQSPSLKGKNPVTRVPFYTCLHPVVIRNLNLTEKIPEVHINNQVCSTSYYPFQKYGQRHHILTSNPGHQSLITAYNFSFLLVQSQNSILSLIARITSSVKASFIL